VTGERAAGLAVDAQVRRGGFLLDVALSVAPGEVVGVLGPNGSGKSTLLKALAGLIPITTGQIALGGKVLDDARTGTFAEPSARPVGFVFQDYRLFPHLSVLENVAFSPRARGAGGGQPASATSPRRESRGDADPELVTLPPFSSVATTPVASSSSSTTLSCHVRDEGFRVSPWVVLITPVPRMVPSGTSKTGVGEGLLDTVAQAFRLDRVIAEGRGHDRCRAPGRRAGPRSPACPDKRAPHRLPGHARRM